MTAETITMTVEGFLALVRRMEAQIEVARQEAQRENFRMQDHSAQARLWRDLAYHFAGGVMPEIGTEIELVMPSDSWTPKLKERWTDADDLKARMQHYITPVRP